jgi:hypothetical protein
MIPVVYERGISLLPRSRERDLDDYVRTIMPRKEEEGKVIPSIHQVGMYVY